MRVKGEQFWSRGTDPNSKVNEASVTTKHISIDWEEHGLEWHLDADSEDGEHFSGCYGSPRKNPEYEFKLTLYRSKSEYLLLGTWYQHDTGDEGTWFFKLTPNAGRASAVRSKRTNS